MKFDVKLINADSDWSMICLPDRQKAIALTNDDLVHWYIYASPGFNGLTTVCIQISFLMIDIGYMLLMNPPTPIMNSCACCISFTIKKSSFVCRDHLVHVSSQWEPTLHCNIGSYWLHTFKNDPYV